MDRDCATLIGLDWGTSTLRAYLFDAAGRVRETRAGDCGIQRIRDGRFGAAFEALCGSWLAAHPRIPAIACGMIGSRQGWREAAYVQAPAGFDDLARGCVTAAGVGHTSVTLVPGVATRHADGEHDVMRGEETQVAGALRALAPSGGVLVLPGTHSKWVRVRDGRIEDFRTYLTGELFAVLSEHSILGRLFAGPAIPDGAATPDGAAAHDAAHDPACERAFDAGLAQAARDPAGLTGALFSVRAEGLFGTYPPYALPDYLSGLLIGAEIAHARDAFAAPAGDAPLQPAIVAEPALARRYALALHRLGMGPKIVPGTPAADGLWAIAVAAGLVAADRIPPAQALA